MLKPIVRAAFVTLLFCISAGSAAVLSITAAQAADKLSKAVGPTINDVQKLLQAKDYPGAMAKLKEAQAISDRTPFDDYIIDRLIVSAAVGMQDMATATTAEEAAADSPAMPDDDKKVVYHDALELSIQAQQYPKAIGYGQQLAAMNALDEVTAGMLAMAYYNAKDMPHAQQFAQQSISIAKAAGKQPDPNALQIVMNSQVASKNEAGAEQTLEQLAVQTGSPADWGELLDVALSTHGIKDQDALYLYRLRLVVGAMTHPDDYTIMASVAEELGYPTEAANVLQQGLSSGKITSAQAGATLSKARREAAADQRSLPSISSAAERSKSGEQDVKLGEDYWGYGRYADAEAAARRAIGKGGLRLPSEGPLLLGASQAAQGKYADATQTLSQVAGSEAATKTAHLWSLYAQAKQGPAQPAAPAPASQPPAH